MSGLVGLGSGIHLLDISVLQRMRNPAVREVVDRAMAHGRAARCVVVELETIYACRGAEEIAQAEAGFSPLAEAPVDRSVMEAARRAMADLAERSHGYHRVSVPDAITAAAASARGFAVLHYDRDFDRLAEVLGFESRWVVPPGSVD